jgi:uncharacterized RDD family membrane protein YckC
VPFKEQRKSTVRIKDIFLANFPRHLGYGVIAALTAAFLCLSWGCIDTYEKWDLEKQAFLEWKKIEVKCREIAKQPVSQSELESYTPPKTENPYLWDAEQLQIESLDPKELKEEINNFRVDRHKESIINVRLLAAKCPEISFGAFPKLKPTENLVAFTLAEQGAKKFIFFTFLFSLSSTLLLLDSGKKLIKIGHKGWTRTSFIFSGVCGALFFLSNRDELDGEELLLYSLVSSFGAWIAFAYGVAAYKWVAEGFERPTSDSRDSVPRQTEPEARKIGTNATLSDGHYTASATPQKATTVDYSEAFWRRAWARCIDLAICWFLGSVVAEILLSFAPSLNPFSEMWVDLLIFQASLCVAAFYYEWLFLSKLGATPGKIAVRLKVFSTDNRLPTAAEAKTRAWSYLISGSYLLLWTPMLQVVSAFQAKKRIPAMQPWELASRTYVWKPPIGRVRVWIVGFVAIFLMLSMFTIQQALKKERKLQVTEYVLGR